MALLPEQIPEHDRKLIGLVVEAEALGPADESLLGFAELRNTGEIALDVGGENRDPGPRQALGQDLQRNGLPGAGGTGHQAVPIGQGERQDFRFAALANENSAVCIDVRHSLILALELPLIVAAGNGRSTMPSRDSLDEQIAAPALARALSP